MASRISRHVFVECTANCYFIVSSLCTRKDTQVISIEPTSGQLVYTAIPGVDLFPKEQNALAAISQRFGGVLHVLPFAAILGYVVFGREAWLHIATKVDSCFPQFPSSFSLVHRALVYAERPRGRKFDSESFLTPAGFSSSTGWSAQPGRKAAEAPPVTRSRYYKVPWQQCPEMVSRPNCFLWRGSLYLIQEELPALLLPIFRTVCII
ncbi:hypothetical protein PAPYR_8327 [Paratrimastix pyriformis]|uniref:Uncharacterized protein n=1 Tax=Paratrimastix pyriformis TaxID=342808 RepID=A0ABQ8UAV3_9EUKA|nr:hypothetical protein PAPYR_8327 [Paratrimastix pyriformis]